MTNHYKIEHYHKFFIKHLNSDVYTIHREDNNCPDIKVGDTIEVEGETFEIEKMEKFSKAFGLEGQNIAVVVKERNKLL